MPTKEPSSQKSLVFRDITDAGWQRQLLRGVCLPTMQKFVLQAINNRGGHRPIADRRPGIFGCTASHAKLGEDMNVDEETVGRAIRALKKAGLIDAEKRGCHGGSIFEDKRICWSNLDALWQEQQEALSPRAVHETDSETDSHSDSETDSAPDKVNKCVSVKDPPPLIPSEASATSVAKPPALPEGWGKVRKALQAKTFAVRTRDGKIVEQKLAAPLRKLCERLAASGVPPALALKVIDATSRDATPAGLYNALLDLGPDDVEEWRRELAARIRAAGEAEGRTEAEIVACLQKNRVFGPSHSQQEEPTP